MSLAEDVRPISRTNPSTCQKIKYSKRSDTPGSCPTRDYRWSATQARLLAPHRLLETSIAAAADERPAARHALQTALALAQPLDALRPFIQAGPHVRELLIHQRGSFGAAEPFANRVLATDAGPQRQTAMLSEREITVLALLPSMLSLEEIALDLTVSVNTVKSHLRSIFTKLGVSSRRLAVLTAHEHGLLHTSLR
jgi:LuxR family transcriptional regulator, maltose regulon positive regulatory protein